MSLKQVSTIETFIKITNPDTWPPGSIMIFQSPNHFGLGIVVANRKGSIAVVWDHKCDKPFMVYDVTTLNPSAISRLL